MYSSASFLYFSPLEEPNSLDFYFWEMNFIFLKGVFENT